jgi:hypothetical protein
LFKELDVSGRQVPVLKNLDGGERLEHIFDRTRGAAAALMRHR